MKKISIIIISDTHNKHKQLGILPDADVIIHCGDFTSIGREHEIRNFFKWFSNLNQYKHKIIIAGNHDMMFESNGMHARSLVPPNVIYLQDNFINIEGYNFYGTPVQKIFGNWAFNKTDESLEKYYKEIPENTDILITHNPPYMVGDYVPFSKSNQGSISLFNEIVNRVKPILSCYGHIHEGRGVKVIDGITFINASNLDDNYDCVYKPTLIEINETGDVNIMDF